MCQKISNLQSPISNLHSHKFAFTLVELSVVLVIIGLIVGGVLVGQSLIKAAEMRSVITELEYYKTAVNTFKIKYNALPGDMKDAQLFFGVSPYCGTADQGNHQYTGACNGGGDGYVFYTTVGGGSGIVYFGEEQFYFWQHLANAGMITGKYSGNSGAGHNYQDGVAGVNVPNAKLNNATWCAVASGTGWVFQRDYRNSLSIGSAKPEGSLGACPPTLLSRKEAYDIDTKIDDGLPAKGIAVVNNIQACSSVGNPAINYTNLNVDYALNTTAYGETSDAKVCALMFLNSFY